MLMTDADRALEREARVIQERINGTLTKFRGRLFRRDMHPVEAMAVLGTLTLDAFRMLPREDRVANCIAWTDNIRAAVRDTLG